MLNERTNKWWEFKGPAVTSREWLWKHVGMEDDRWLDKKS